MVWEMFCRHLQTCSEENKSGRNHGKNNHNISGHISFNSKHKRIRRKISISLKISTEEKILLNLVLPCSMTEQKSSTKNRKCSIKNEEQKNENFQMISWFLPKYISTRKKYGSQQKYKNLISVKCFWTEIISWQDCMQLKWYRELLITSLLMGIRRKYQWIFYDIWTLLGRMKEWFKTKVKSISNSVKEIIIHKKWLQHESIAFAKASGRICSLIKSVNQNAHKQATPAPCLY